MSTNLLLLFLIITSCFVTIRSDVFNVVHYGAAGDGRTDDTEAFTKAWEDTCKSSDNWATMLIPSGKEFFVQPMRFEGPCHSNTVFLQIDGTLVGAEDPSDWIRKDIWISVRNVDGIHVQGRGTLNGRGQKWWTDHKNDHTKPVALMISKCKNCFLDGLTFKNNPRMHIVLNDLVDISVTNITIDSPEDSPNTDGIHVTSSTNVNIANCHIGTGDDCISIVDGAAYVTISNIVCGPGHGISIGSLGHNGATDKVEYVHVSDSVFRGASNGLRIKTWKGGNGYARNMRFERILAHETQYPIIIDQSYCIDQHCLSDSNSAVQIRNITYQEVMGTTKKKKDGVKLDCSKAKPCDEIYLENIHIVTPDNKDAQYQCSNVIGKTKGQIVPRLDSCFS